MLERIAQGHLPSVVFRRVIQEDPTAGNIKLGELLSEEFPDLSGEGLQLVWHWKGPGREQGLNDENLDALLCKILREAGYL